MRVWQMVIVALSVLMLLGVCGLGSYLIVIDERQGRKIRAAPAPTALPRDISSRKVDPAPLTVKEVFPSKKIVIPTGETYRVLKTQAVKDCRATVTEKLRNLLAELGCTQVVRGTLRSPTGDYLVTAGIANLQDLAAADAAHEKIKPLVDAQKGRFLGMSAGKGTYAIGFSSAQVGWHTRGHFLVYCVIAKSNGKAIGENDPYARQILYDMIELHLRGTVLERRATVLVTPTPSDLATPAGPGGQ